MTASYDSAISFLNSLSRFGWRLGLERMEMLCERLGHPERSFASIHIAGTNGKGSTATYLARLIQAAGYRTGLYTSPHLVDGRERIQVDGAMIPREAVVRHIAELAPHIAAVQQAHGPVTEFEAWTCVMFLHFRAQGVHTAIIEAGLGGRWDSTNVIEPKLALLTNVSLDHTDRLGKTISEIAHDKAGIIKPVGKILCGPLTDEAAREVEAEVRRKGARLYALLPADQRASPRGASETFFWELVDASAILLIAGDGDQRVISFTGPRYQAQNVALVAAAAMVLRKEAGYELNEQAEQVAFTSPMPGRFQVIRERPRVILDGAHNPAAAATLATELAAEIGADASRAEYARAEGLGVPALRLVFGASSGHDAESCLKILAPLADEVILTRAVNQRSRPPAELARVAQEAGVPWEVIEDVSGALDTAVSRSRPTDRVCVTGSLFVIGEVLARTPGAKVAVAAPSKLSR